MAAFYTRKGREMDRVFKREGMGRAGIEPDIQNVVDFFIIGGVVVGREKTLGRAVLVPGVGAFLFERSDDPGVDLFIDQNVVAAFLTKTAIGTPQARWRDTTQSGRLAIMPVMRFSPAAGTHLVRPISSSATSRKVGRLEAPSPLAATASSATTKGLSIAMNHCGVLRKITGFFERQLCGYWCFRRPRASSASASTRA